MGRPARARRFNIRVPRYQQIISALTWMSHAQNLRRVAAEHTIDLYLRPPVTRFRLMDYHLMERIVRDANRCAPRPRPAPPRPPALAPAPRGRLDRGRAVSGTPASGWRARARPPAPARSRET